MYRLCVSTCISLLTNTYGCEQVSGCAVPGLGKYVQMELVCIQSVPVQDVHIPQGHSAWKPLTLSPCLPRISRGTNAIVKSKTYDPFCDFIFQSPNRVKLIELDSI